MWTRDNTGCISWPGNAAKMAKLPMFVAGHLQQSLSATQQRGGLTHRDMAPLG